MGIRSNHLRDEIIIPTLKFLDLYSESALNLLMGIAAHESGVGTYLKQINGPALGIYQCEPFTEREILKYVRVKRPLLFRKIEGLRARSGVVSDLIGNFPYATAICRVHFIRFPQPLPPANDIRALATYWKSYYNTIQGKGEIDEFLNMYKHYVG